MIAISTITKHRGRWTMANIMQIVVKNISKTHHGMKTRGHLLGLLTGVRQLCGMVFRGGNWCSFSLKITNKSTVQPSSILTMRRVLW